MKKVLWKFNKNPKITDPKLKMEAWKMKMILRRLSSKAAESRAKEFDYRFARAIITGEKGFFVGTDYYEVNTKFRIVSFIIRLFI